MRKLNDEERILLEIDLILFVETLRTIDLLSDKVLNKFDSITFYVKSEKELGETFAGETYFTPQTGETTICILDTYMTNDRLRSHTCYHELGHALMGALSYESDDIREKAILPLVEIKCKYLDELIEDWYTYISGLNCLEEYLAEIFAQAMQFMCKNIDVPKKQRCTSLSICADYEFQSTMNIAYGIFEEICDELIRKTFGDLNTAIRAGLAEEYFGAFFEKFDGKEIMKILGNLGKVHQAINNYGQPSISGYNQYSPDEIKRILIDTEQLVKNIQPTDPGMNLQRGWI